MRQALLLALFLAFAAVAQERQPTPDEIAFARLPRDLQALLGHLPAREALKKLDYARQNLVALGVPSPTPDQVRGAVEVALNPQYAAVRSMSAGTTTFPPLSPLVPENAFDYR
jgi:MoxR-like ATPase